MTPLRESDARVLVLDDEPVNTDLLVRLLGRAGSQTVLASNDPLVFEERLQSLEPDLILLDLHLSEQPTAPCVDKPDDYCSAKIAASSATTSR
jgi:CheY-like chemotaxis protein